MKKILLVVVVGIASGVVYLIASPARNVGYAPRQPIPFSHKLHAGQYQIPCQYCHVSPERGPHSTVPTANVCMNCHSAVKVDSPHIKEIRRHWEENKPIEWIRIHEIGDYAHFNHQRHLARGIDCIQCHGDVANMDVVRQTSPMTMGWCIQCHQDPQHNASTSCSTCHY